MLDRRLIISWVRLTWLGWLLGVPLVVVLALVAEAVGVGGVQAIVGAGMGIGVGLMQGRLIRRLLDRSAAWLCSCAVGLGAPFMLTDVSKAAGWDIPYSLLASIALGGLVVGVWQSLILRSRLRRTGWWVVGSALGWTLAASTSSIAESLQRSQSLRGLWGALAYLGIVAAGGLVLGAVTGICLAWMFRHEPAT
ncbi:MAG: hypothetical protein ABW208_01845 [Pyrinomonadaceae bacterium]